MVENEFGMIWLLVLMVVSCYSWFRFEDIARQRAKKRYYRQINRIRKEI